MFIEKFQNIGGVPTLPSTQIQKTVFTQGWSVPLKTGETVELKNGLTVIVLVIDEHKVNNSIWISDVKYVWR